MMLEELIWIVVVILILVGILLYFSRLKKTGRWGWDLPMKLGGDIKLGGATGFLAGYLVPTILFIVLLGVLWLTNDTLHWWSFFTRDGKTFAALTITYFVFASAFMQEKKKAPLYQKVMVLTMIVAVAITLMEVSPSSAWSTYGWSGTKYDRAEAIETASAAPVPVQAIQRSQVRTVEVIAEEGAFTEVKIPDLSKFDFVCPPGALMVIVHSGIPEGQVVDCDLQVKLALSSNLRGLRLGFQSKDSTPRHVTVTITKQG